MNSSGSISTCAVVEVIRTTLTLRGNGRDDPLRHIEQFWSKDGCLLAENDPCPPNIVLPERLSEATVVRLRDDPTLTNMTETQICLLWNVLRARLLEESFERTGRRA